jgi:hypothetical protein
MWLCVLAAQAALALSFGLGMLARVVLFGWNFTDEIFRFLFTPARLPKADPDA